MEPGQADEPAAKRQRVEVDRIKRKKVAMLLAYSGQGYYGMQRNPETKTIEEDLLLALLASNLITDEAFTTAQTIQFQRAARTDKGVSAARQVVSMKLPDGAKIEDINSFLPPTIRVLALRRTTKGFNCKTSCDARTYSYLMPSMALSPDAPDPSYRAQPAHLKAFRQTLCQFQGTHNFHNFTSKKLPGDPSALRYIMCFHCGDPFTVDPVAMEAVPVEAAAATPPAVELGDEEPLSPVQGPLEFVELRVKGQSFMLHQIRKMIGLAVAVARGLATLETMKRSFGSERIDIPVAPGLGLVLEQVHYERYNQRYGADGIHKPLHWKSLDAEVERFKRTYIQPAIVAAETTHQPMRRWLLTLPLHTYSVRHHHLHQAGAEVTAAAGAEQVAAAAAGGEQVAAAAGEQVATVGTEQVVAGGAGAEPVAAEGKPVEVGADQQATEPQVASSDAQVARSEPQVASTDAQVASTDAQVVNAEKEESNGGELVDAEQPSVEGEQEVNGGATVVEGKASDDGQQAALPETKP